MFASEKPAWWSLVADPLAREQLQALRSAAEHRLYEDRWARERQGLSLITELRASDLDASGAAVRIGRQEDLKEGQQEKLDAALSAFRPWKKGPFSIMGREIDAEWRSDWKWDRFWPSIRSLSGETVADIGCNNGYYMYRILAAGAKQVIGFEPMARNALHFQLMQTLWPTKSIDFELLGAEHIDIFGPIFDTIFCLGILYHHTDPIGLLRKMAKALKPRGRLFIDCQGIAGDMPLALTPASRYAGATGIWFLPTQSCLEHWIRRAGFTKLNWIYADRLSCLEQRSTAWAPIKSLADFLDPSDINQTIEAYPAPERFYLMVQL